MYRRLKNQQVNDEEFRSLYEKDGYGEEGIAKKLGISVHAARCHIKRLGLKKHPRSRIGIKPREETKRKISLANSGRKLSEEHRQKVIKTLRHGRGCEHASWRGGIVRREGYVYIHLPNHPRSQKSGYIKRAILVAEKSLGRMLTDGEVTHHINGIKDDDRPENISVLLAHQHNVITAKERWARGDFIKILPHLKRRKIHGI